MLARLNRKTVAVLSGITASLLCATGAIAAQNPPVVVYAEQQPLNVERVPYGDLNLAASTDLKTLYSRVGNAVRNVCNFDAAGVSSDYRACSSISWKDARHQITAAIARSDQLALAGKPAAGSRTIVIGSR